MFKVNPTFKEFQFLIIKWILCSNLFVQPFLSSWQFLYNLAKYIFTKFQCSNFCLVVWNFLYQVWFSWIISTENSLTSSHPSPIFPIGFPTTSFRALLPSKHISSQYISISLYYLYLFFPLGYSNHKHAFSFSQLYLT